MMSFIVGFITALVVIQFFPNVANIGKWLVTKTGTIVKKGE